MLVELILLFLGMAGVMGWGTYWVLGEIAEVLGPIPQFPRILISILVGIVVLWFFAEESNLELN